MVLRFILRFLLSERVIDKLADSYPIRRAARWAVYFFNRAKALKPDEDLLNESNKERLKGLGVKLENSLKKIKEDLEKKANK